jgi:hypothetical protein
MSRMFRFAFLLVGSAFLISGVSRGADKESQKSQAKPLLPVELTEKAQDGWLLKKVKIGTKISTDREYLIRAVPEEIIGGTYVLRPQDDLHGWLPDMAVNAKKDVKVYALIQTQYLGKVLFDEVAENLLEKDGWKAVAGKVTTTFPAGEMWAWKAYKKEVGEGDVILQLEHLKWDNRPLIVFVFK